MTAAGFASVCMLKSLIAGFVALLAATFGLHHSTASTPSVVRPQTGIPYTVYFAAAAVPEATPPATTPSFQDLSSGGQSAADPTSPAHPAASPDAQQQQFNPIAVASQQPVALDPLTDYVTQEDLASVTAALSAKFSSDIAALSPLSAKTAPTPQWVAGGGDYAAPFAAAQAINNLSGVTITNANLTISEIPDLSSKYLSLNNGGAVTGNTMFAGDLSVGTTTPASTALFSVGTSTSLLYIDSNSGAVDIDSTNANVAPFFVNSSFPKQISTLPSGYFTSVITSGNYLYGIQVLSQGKPGNMGLSVYDISVPTSPALVSSTVISEPQAGNIISQLRISGHYLYTIDDSGGGNGNPGNIKVFDVSNPSNPVALVPTGGGLEASFPAALDVAGRYVYAGGLNSFNVVDMSDPLYPLTVASQLQNSSPYFTGIDVRGDYAYGLDLNSNTFDIINIRNPATPTLSGTVALTAVNYSEEPQIAFSGNYAYTTTSGSLSVINISSTTPSIAATVTIPGGLSGQNGGIIANGHYLYADTANGLAVFDITNQTSPQLVDTIASITGSFTISGRYLYASGGGVYDLGGGYIQTLGVGNLYLGSLSVSQSSIFQRNIDALGGIDVGPVGFVSYGPGGFSSTGGPNVVEITAATTSNSTGQTASFDAGLIRNFATSSTASIIKTGLNIISQGSWTGTGAKNIGLYVSSVTGGTNNYDAIFNGGGDVGIGTSSPSSRLTVWGPDTASTTAFAVVNSASTTVFAVYDSGNSTYSGSIFQSSDERLKTGVQSLDASTSLSLLEQLNPVSYLRLDQPGGGENLGFLAQQVGGVFPELVSTTSPTALTPDGTLTLNYEGLIAPIVSAIQDLADISGAFQQNLIAWLGNASNGIQDLYAQRVHTSELCDGSTCVSVQQLVALLASQPASGQGSGSSGAQATSTPDTPPVIQINGDNPATLEVGATYDDLGATITGPQQDLNLGITTYLNGTLESPVEVDTSQPATDTIDYVVTDGAGNTSTSTRTIIIETVGSTTPS